MQTIVAVLFENPVYLAILWVPMQMSLLVLWSKTRTNATARLVWVGFALLPAGLVMQGLVVTKKEAVQATCRRLAAAAEENHVRFISEHIADDFSATIKKRSEPLDKKQMVALLEESLQRTSVSNVRLSHWSLERNADGTITAEFDAKARISRADYEGQFPSSGFRVVFEKHGDQWVITTAKIIKRMHSPLGDLTELLR